MTMRILVAVSAALALATAGSLSSVWADTQQQSPPKKGPLPQTSQTPSESEVRHQGEMAMENETIMDHMTVIMQVDSMMQRMDVLRERARAYSKSFGDLAAIHHGADRKEILMMQRMSDSMGIMAGEVRVSLHQYKDLLENETASESGKTRAEVQNLKFILDGIGRDVEGAVDRLQVLEEQLGQG